MLNPQDISPS